MKFIKSVKYVNRISIFSFLLGLLLVTAVRADSRVDTVINNTWKFNKADVANAHLPSFNDTSWSTIDLPHTWNALDGEDGGTHEKSIRMSMADYLKLVGPKVLEFSRHVAS